MAISQDTEQRVVNTIRKHPQKKDHAIARLITTVEDGRRKRLVKAADVHEVRQNMQQNKDDGSNGYTGQNGVDLTKVCTDAEEAEYSVDYAQQILDWLRTHADHPVTDKPAFWPESVVRTELGLNQNQMRSALQDERLSPLVEQLRNERHLCWYPEAVTRVRQKKMGSRG